GVVGADAVTRTGTGSFASAGVGTAKTVTGSDLTLSGAAAGNYALSSTSASTTANITAATLTPAITAANKTYDGTSSATISCTLTGVVGADVVTCAGTGSFASAGVGTAKTVTSSDLTLSGAQAGNYALSSTSASTTANITAATLTPAITAANYALSSTTATTTANITAATLTPAITAANKTYDGMSAATITCTLTGVIGTDVVTCSGTGSFDTASVGNGKSVTSSSLTLGG